MTKTKYPDPDQLWQIHGKYYDLEPFLKLHPGGRRLLHQVRGTDCTALFESTHLHDRIPKKLLERYYVADKTDYSPSFEWEGEGFYPTVKRRVQEHFKNKARQQGLSGARTREIHHGTRIFLARLVLVWLLWIGLSIGAVLYGNLFCALLWGPFAFALGGYGHEAMHAGVLPSVRGNRFVALITLDLAGLSSYIFTATHVPLHHVYTNVPDKDPDVEVHFPLIRERFDQPRFFFHCAQHFYAWIIYILTLPIIWATDFIAAATGTWFGPWARLRKPDTKETLLMLAFKPVALGLWYVLPALLHGWAYGALLSLIMIGVTGLMVQGTFAVNHQNALAMNHDQRPSSHPRDWGVQQMETTANFSNQHWLPVLFFGGLGYQIEHHLFPTLSYSQLNEVAPIVKETCREFQTPYHYYPTVFDAFHAHYLFLKRLGQETDWDPPRANRTSDENRRSTIPATD